MIKRTLFFMLVAFLLISCKSEQQIDLDAQKTKELISQIMKTREGYIDTANCITEGSGSADIRSIEDMQYLAERHLGITDSLHLKNQLDLFQAFKITEEYAGQLKIITDATFKELEERSQKGEVNFFDWLISNCTNGYWSIAKPIFNETYDLALVVDGSLCGPLCGGGGTYIYKLQDGQWVEFKIISSWVS